MLFFPCVYFSKIPKSFGDFNQRVTSIDDRLYLAGLTKLNKKIQILACTIQEKAGKLKSRAIDIYQL